MINCHLACTVSKEMRPRLYGKPEPCVRRADRIYGVDSRARNRRGRAEDKLRQVDLLIGEAAVILVA